MAEAIPRWLRAAPGVALGLGLLVCLLLPVAALGLASSPRELLAALEHPLVLPALGLSAWTSLVALVVVVITGTPLAWMLARARGRDVLLGLLLYPVVIPILLMGTRGTEALLAVPADLARAWLFDRLGGNR